MIIQIITRITITMIQWSTPTYFFSSLFRKIPQENYRNPYTFRFYPSQTPDFASGSQSFHDLFRNPPSVETLLLNPPKKIETKKSTKTWKKLGKVPIPLKFVCPCLLQTKTAMAIFGVFKTTGSDDKPLGQPVGDPTDPDLGPLLAQQTHGFCQVWVPGDGKDS